MTFQQYNKGKETNITSGVVIFFLVCIVLWLLASSMDDTVDGQAIAEQQTTTVEPTALPVIPPLPPPPAIPEPIAPEEVYIPDTYIPAPAVPIVPSTSEAPPAPLPKYYSSCAEAPGPLFAGEPGYSTQLDRDGDGVACELN